MPEQIKLSDTVECDREEKLLLSMLIANPELIPEVEKILPAGNFIGCNRLYFQKLYNGCLAVADLPELESVVGKDTTILINKIKEVYSKKKIANVIENLIIELNSGNSAVEILRKSQEQLAFIQEELGGNNRSTIIEMTSLIPLIFEDIKARKEARSRGEFLGLPTGVPKLDLLLGGLQTGLHCIGAPPGAGKTTFTLSVAKNISQKSIPVVFVSFEEQIIRLGLKLICSSNGLEAKKFSEGYEDINKFQNAAKESQTILKNIFFIEGSEEVNAGYIEQEVQDLLKKLKTDKCLVIVDYLQRMAAIKSIGGDDFRLRVSSLVSSLRQISINLNSPVLVVCSQNRNGQGGTKLTSLKESGDIEYGADTVMFLNQDKERKMLPPERAMILSVEKNRYGDNADIQLIFKPNVGTFYEEAKI